MARPSSTRSKRMSQKWRRDVPSGRKACASASQRPIKASYSVSTSMPRTLQGRGSRRCRNLALFSQRGGRCAEHPAKGEGEMAVVRESEIEGDSAKFTRRIEYLDQRC